jgi:uncharacterized Fe-S cluster-containing radical SAM superfamily protein
MPTSSGEGRISTGWRPSSPTYPVDSHCLTMNDYPGYLKEGFQPYDPIELIGLTEEKVCQGDARKYTDFYCVSVYGGISTGYLVGCCLRCVFCWVNPSRDFPDRYGRFYTSDQVAERLTANARRQGVSKLRISGGEPTLGRDHLLGVLDRTDGCGFTFILETNGIPLGHDPDYAQALAQYRDVHVRVSLKAGSAAGFEVRTGAQGEYWELPFQAIERLMAAGVSFHVAAMTDPRLMPAEERAALMTRLRHANYTGWVEEERCDAYRSTVKRLQAAGWDLF